MNHSRTQERTERKLKLKYEIDLTEQAEMNLLCPACLAADNYERGQPELFYHSRWDITQGLMCPVCFFKVHFHVLEVGEN